MYIKVVNRNGEIVGAENLINPEYVSFQERNHIFLRNESDCGEGVISLDGSQIYAINGVEQKTDELEFTAVEISEADYDYYAQQLEWPIKPEDTENPTEGETILTPIEMMREIKELKDYVGDLRAENEFLTDCLLEMSEAVYA